jgi:type IV secretion system protein TrbL
VSSCPQVQSINPICRIGQVIDGASHTVAGDIFGSIAHYFAAVATSAVSWLWDQLDAATSVDLTSAGIRHDLVATGSIAALVTVILFLIQVIASVLRQHAGGLGRALRGLALSFIGSAFAVATTQVLLGAVDGLSNGVVHYALGTDVKGLGAQLVVASTLTAIVNPAGLLLMSLILISAVVVIWVALMVRKMLIIISAVFAPIAFAGAASEMSRSWVRRWIELTAALVMSKLILVIIFLVGLSVLEGGGRTPGSPRLHETQAITNLVIGALILLLAGLAPWIAIKAVHFAGDSFEGLHAQTAVAGTAAQTAIAAPRKLASVTGLGSPRAWSEGGSGTGGAVGASGAARHRRMPRPGAYPANAAGPEPDLVPDIAPTAAGADLAGDPAGSVTPGVQGGRGDGGN